MLLFVAFHPKRFDHTCAFMATVSVLSLLIIKLWLLFQRLRRKSSHVRV